jgi:hypothetical protein
VIFSISKKVQILREMDAGLSQKRAALKYNVDKQTTYWTTHFYGRQGHPKRSQCTRVQRSKFSQKILSNSQRY